MKKFNKRIIFCLLGNVIEWYEFSLFIYLSKIIIYDLSGSNVAQQGFLGLFLVYSIGFLFRPLGAILIGYIGDVYGRKPALLYSVLMMSLGTTVLGLIPSSLGVFSICLLIVCRAVQGLSGGGEFTTSLVYLSEETDDKSKKIICSLSYSSAQLGLLLGAATGALLSYTIRAEILPVWSWRFGFFFCLPATIACYFIRKVTIKENEDYSSKSKLGLISHYRNVIYGNKKSIFSIVGINAFAQTVFYVFSFCVINWHVEEYANFELAVEFLVKNSLFLLTVIVLIPCAAFLYTDKNKPLILNVSIFILIPILVLLLNTRMVNEAHYLLPFLGAIFIALILAPLPEIYSSLFPPKIRNAGVSLPFNFSAAIFGGLSPAIILHYLSDNNMFFITIYLLILACVASISLSLAWYKRSQ